MPSINHPVPVGEYWQKVDIMMRKDDGQSIRSPGWIYNHQLWHCHLGEDLQSIWDLDQILETILKYPSTNSNSSSKGWINDIDNNEYINIADRASCFMLVASSQPLSDAQWSPCLIHSFNIVPMQVNPVTQFFSQLQFNTVIQLIMLLFWYNRI